MALHFSKGSAKRLRDAGGQGERQDILNRHLLLERGCMKRSAVPLIVMLVFSLSLGYVFYKTIGPLTIPDNNMHWLETYALATGQAFAPSEEYTDGAGNTMTRQYAEVDRGLLSDGFNNDVVSKIIELPNSYDENLEEQVEDLDKGWTGTTVRYERRSQYFPLVYSVQALAFGAAKAAGATPLRALQSMRLANFFAALLIEAFAIVLVPRGKMIFALICALPTTVFLAISISVDATIPGFVMLLLAATLRALDRGKMTPTLVVLCALSSVALFFLKTAYVFTALSPLLLPNNVLGKRKKALVCLVVVVPSLMVYLWWKSLVSFTFSPLYNISENMTLIMQDIPSALLRVFTTITRIPFWFCDPPTRSVVCVLTILAATLFSMRNIEFDKGVARSSFKDMLLRWRMPLCAVICFLLSCFAMCYTFLVSWSEVAPAFVFLDGWQERYFLPLLPLLVLFLYPVERCDTTGNYSRVQDSAS